MSLALPRSKSLIKRAREVKWFMSHNNTFTTSSSTLHDREEFVKRQNFTHYESRYIPALAKPCIIAQTARLL